MDVIRLNRYNIRLPHLCLFLVAFFLCIGLQFTNSSKVSAAAFTNSHFIDNSLLLDANSLSADGIQTFLASKSGTLKSANFLMDCDVTGTTAKQQYQSIGAPCGQTVSAARIIYYSSQVYGINPKAVLATMQKEQSLVTDPSPTPRAYNQAMGFACPDSGGCSASSNFFYQIDNGAWALRYHYERANGNNTYWNTKSWTCGTNKNYYTPNLYPRQNVNFYDDSGTLYATVYVTNAATSSFYCYTPHAYNNPQGLYGRPAFGTTGNYYSGSYNFVYYYELWFGSTYAVPSNCNSKVTNVTCVWRLQSLTGSEFLTTSTGERDAALKSANWSYVGTDFYAFTGQVPGSIPVYRFVLGSGRHFYTTDTAERDSLAQNSANVSEGIVFYVYPATTSPNAAYPIYRSVSSTYGHRYTASPNTSSTFTNEGIRFFTPSGAANTASAPAGRNYVYRVLSPSGRDHFYTTSLIERDQAILASGYIYEGTAFDVNNSSSGTPIYRLSNRANGGHYYTPSVSDRDALISNFGWTSEGTAFYIDNNNSQVYQFYNAQTDDHFYTVDITEATLISNVSGWKYERVAFGVKQQNTTTPLYRMFSPSQGHFFSTDINEILNNVNVGGWKYEGIALDVTTQTTSAPVYRLYSSSTGEHFYTTNSQEKDALVNAGLFLYEGIAFHSIASPTATPVYRLVNKSSPSRHFYTTSAQERDLNVNRGTWIYEGTAWYN